MPSTNTHKIHPTRAALAAFALLMRWHLGEEDLVLATVFQGRRRELPIRVRDSDATLGFADLLGEALDPGAT